ncbi:MAG: 50S ribosome-binding GTPase, partial [Bacteriovoracaceae bacterium]|nr:50S ribosome-binding GTPase [Bacteriovoracaceae bacterium]
MSSTPIISIMGRPNVGKSLLFNRLMGKAHLNLSFNQAGVTRDRHYGELTLDEWNDKPESSALLVDTGGFYPEKLIETKSKNKKENLDNDAPPLNMTDLFNVMTTQGKLAVQESDLVLLVMDIREGLSPFDEQIVK